MCKKLIFLLIIFTWFNSNAQENKIDSLKTIGVCDMNGFCIPNIANMARPKGISIIRQSTFDYGISSKFKDSTTSQKEEISHNEAIEFKIKFPIILKKQTKIYMGLNYKVEEFEFENPNNLKNEFHQHLEDKPLKTVGSTFYLDKRFKGRHYFYSRASFSLNGDYKDGNEQNYFRSSVTALYGTKVTANKTWGYGLSYSYRFGQLALYPIIHYNKQFNKKWGFEALLPLKTEFRYQPNEKNYFYFVNRLNGANYVLEFNELSDKNLFLAYSEFISLITYEREIYDFLWFTFSAGVRANFRFDLTESNTLIGTDVPLVENELKTAPLIRFGIFIVPPKKMMNKHK
jgi:hypothetical protein